MTTYGLDLTQFSLNSFRQTLASGDLLPSRKILGEQIAARFAALEAAGIVTVKALAEADPAEFYARLLAVNADRQIYQATLGRRDADLTITMAQELPQVVEY
ncbi:MAG: DUF4332 domain-containing protein [Anaerolineae bacterium]|nr:DUF4332 domain-containing protein [Anaerolineae bacterium]